MPHCVRVDLSLAGGVAVWTPLVRPDDYPEDWH